MCGKNIKSMPKISVIIPLYNKEKTIKKTIESVLNQTFTDFEIIVVNDGSTDRSLEIVKSIKSDMLLVFSKENGGVSSARNEGFIYARGEWIMFLDADDIISSNCLEVLYKLMIDFPASNVVSANYTILHARDVEQEGCFITTRGFIEDPFKELWNRKWKLRLGAYALKRYLFEEVGQFSMIMRKGEDTYFDIELAKVAHIAYTPDRIMTYNRTDSYYSKITTPLENSIINYISLDKGSKYERYVKCELLWKGMILRLINGHFKDFFYLIYKYRRHTSLIIKSFFLRFLLHKK